MSDQTKTDLQPGFWRVRFVRDTNCQVGERLVPVKKDQTADVIKHIGQHLIQNEIATLVDDGSGIASK